ncbi:hypothetical protein [Bradyrhizobium shewense]|uniref:hypothetical protein n=1 Tax=Bradyrhizobium shewense TaxID=1761772 RepID=UPI00101AE7C9|nr:hypothetical protein [Bradyrhizobium shewense]
MAAANRRSWFSLLRRIPRFPGNNLWRPAWSVRANDDEDRDCVGSAQGAASVHGVAFNRVTFPCLCGSRSSVRVEKLAGPELPEPAPL